MLPRVIIAVNEEKLAAKIARRLKHLDTLPQIIEASTLDWEMTVRESVDLIVVNRSLISESAFRRIERWRKKPESPRVVVLSAEEDSEDRAHLMAAGCEAVLLIELPPEQIIEVLSTVLERRRDIISAFDMAQSKEWRPDLSDFSSSSSAMQAFMNVVHRVVDVDVPLLVLGETGVGKEWLSRAIHYASPRAQQPFIAVNCGALPEALLESELFGHERGAFTGAHRARRGYFEQAHHGAIFLDEIGEMPLHLQVKLLRVLQEGVIQRLGSEKSVKLDVRIIAATNRDLDAEVGEGRFRRDLFYRLSALRITVPPLRERKEDIPIIAQSYLEYLRPRVNRSIKRIVPAALDALTEYAWPGNVRELINVLERAMLLCEDDEIHLADLPLVIGGVLLTAKQDYAEDGAQLSETFDHKWLALELREARRLQQNEFERAYLSALLKETKGRINETARRAGVGRRSLYTKMQHLGLKKEGFRE